MLLEVPAKPRGRMLSHSREDVAGFRPTHRGRRLPEPTPPAGQLFPVDPQPVGFSRVVPGRLPQLQSLHVLPDSQAAAKKSRGAWLLCLCRGPSLPRSLSAPVGSGGWPISNSPEGRGLWVENRDAGFPEDPQGCLGTRRVGCPAASTGRSAAGVGAFQKAENTIRDFLVHLLLREVT